MAKTREFQIAARIRERMHALELRPEDVAYDMRRLGYGVTSQSVRNWRKDAQRMSGRFLRPLAIVLQCSLDHLTGDNDSIGRPPREAVPA